MWWNKGTEKKKRRGNEEEEIIYLNKKEFLNALVLRFIWHTFILRLLIFCSHSHNAMEILLSSAHLGCKVTPVQGIQWISNFSCKPFLNLLRNFPWELWKLHWVFFLFLIYLKLSFMNRYCLQSPLKLGN